MLVPQVLTDGIEMILGKVLHRQRAVCAMSLSFGAAQRQIGWVGMTQRIVAAEGIVCVTRPRVVERIGRPVGADRVQLDIAIAVQQVGFLIDQWRFVAPSHNVPARR